MALFGRREQEAEEVYYDAPATEQFFGQADKNDAYLQSLAQITLDNSQLLEEVENALRGRKIVLKEGRAAYSDVEHPAMNEEGIQAILSEVHARVGKNVILSNLTDSDARKLMKKIHVELVFLIAQNSRRFEIDDGRKSAVLWQVSNLIWFSLSRAVGDGERNKLYKRPQEIRTISEHVPSRRGGWLFGGGQ